MTTTLSAADVKKLRDMTGAGMMDCKSALEEAAGDFEKAVEVLRKKGQKLSLKRADREAKEGAVVALTSSDRNHGVLVRLSCETDFVAKNEDFVNFAKSIAEIALQNMPESTEALLNLPFAEGLTIGEKITAQVGIIGEKVEVSHYTKIETAPGKGQVLSYIHMGHRAGVIVALNMDGAEYMEPGKNVAMQIAAMRPVAVDKDGVSAELIEKEIEIGKEQARQEGKPEAMLEKIAVGKLNKFYQENTLLNQAYVKDTKLTVAQYLESMNKDQAGDFKQFRQILKRMSMKTSARNQFAGTIIGLREGDVDFEVRLRLDAQNELVAIITRESAETLGLQIGMEISALVKSSSVLLLTNPNVRTSARNHLWGEVTRILNGPVNAEITLVMPSGKTVCAVVTHDSVEKLGLAVGERACAIFNASAVILCLFA